MNLNEFQIQGRSYSTLLDDGGSGVITNPEPHKPWAELKILPQRVKQTGKRDLLEVFSNLGIGGYNSNTNLFTIPPKLFHKCLFGLIMGYVETSDMGKAKRWAVKEIKNRNPYLNLLSEAVTKKHDVPLTFCL